MFFVFFYCFIKVNLVYLSPSATYHVPGYFLPLVSVYLLFHADDMDAEIYAYETKPAILPADTLYNANTNNDRCSCSVLLHPSHQA